MMVSSMKKYKAGWGMETGGGVAILKKVVREGFKEEVNWSKALKVKGASHRDI